MPQPITMPSLGMYTAEATLVGWKVPSGTAVEAGEPIAEVETDKAVVSLVAPAAGVLSQFAAVGTVIKEQGVLGYILTAGEEPPADGGPAAAAVHASTPGSSTSLHTTASPGQRTGFIKATPVARKLAAHHGIDLSRIEGSGPGGRIVEADVAAAATATAAGPETAAAPPASAFTSGLPMVRSRIALSPMRRAIGERLRRGVDASVSLTLTREVEADHLVAARLELSATFGVSLVYDAFFVKLLAAALTEYPELNATIEHQNLVIFDEVHIGVAMAQSDGLIVPVVRDAHQTPLSSVAKRINELKARLQSNSLRAEDLTDATSTISNLGRFGVDGFTPVLNPPQSTILGIGRIERRPVVRGDAVVAAHTCVLSLTFDHRVTDGVPAAQILERIAARMNDEAYLRSLT